MEEVRIDKYLWSIRVYKTRTDATDACKGGKVRVNGGDIKPSKPVKVGDTIVARKGAVTYTYKVLQLIDKRQGAKLVPNYAENLRRKNSPSSGPLWRPSSSRETEERVDLPRRTAVRWRTSGAISASMFRMTLPSVLPLISDLTILRMISTKIS